MKSSPQSLNRYAYALNSPTNYVDPVGLDSGRGGWPSGVCDGGSYIWCGLGGVFGDVLCYYVGACGDGGGGNPRREPPDSGSASSPPSSAPAPPSGGPIYNGQPPMAGETLGVPNWITLQPLTLWQLAGIVPVDGGWCDWGPCVFDATGDWTPAHLPTKNYADYFACVVGGWWDSGLGFFLGPTYTAYKLSLPPPRTGTRPISGGRFSPKAQAWSDASFYVFAATTAVYTVSSAITIRHNCTKEVYGRP